MSTPDRCPTASWEQEADAPKQLPGLFPGLLPSMSPAATAHVETPRFDLHDVINVEAVRPAVLRLCLDAATFRQCAAHRNFAIEHERGVTRRTPAG